MKCELCLGKKTELPNINNNEGKFITYQCGKCGTISSKPIEIKKSAENFYYSQYQYNKYDKITSITPHHSEILKNKKPFLNEINEIKKVYPKAQSIADMGCGIPFFLYFARQRGYTVHGYDIVNPFFHYVKSVFDITIQKKNAHQLANENKKFDIVRYNHVFEHIYEIENETKNLQKIINPGGLLIINVPNRYNWKENIKIFMNKQKLTGLIDPPHHFFSYSRQGLKKLMARHSFSLEKSFYSACINWESKFFIRFIDTCIIPKNFKADLNLIFRYNIS